MIQQFLKCFVFSIYPAKEHHSSGNYGMVDLRIYRDIRINEDNRH